MDDEDQLYDIELTVDEVEFLTLRYLYQQKLRGRDAVPQAEIMDYLGVGHESPDEDHMLRINADGIKTLKSLRYRYMN